MSALQIHNTLTRKKEPFVPRAPGKAGLYVCGPTVYDYFHIGNARTFSAFDLVVRWLRATGYEVKYVRNITDIDDKIMDRARAQGESIEELTERMVRAFEVDCARLNLVKPDVEPRATRYIGPMLEMIEALEGKGLAYRGANGDVYYSVRKFPDYGKLSRRNLDELRSGERVAVDAAWFGDRADLPEDAPGSSPHVAGKTRMQARLDHIQGFYASFHLNNPVEANANRFSSICQNLQPDGAVTGCDPGYGHNSYFVNTAMCSYANLWDDGQATTPEIRREAIEEAVSTTIENDRYYQESIGVYTLMFLTGNFPNPMTVSPR